MGRKSNLLERNRFPAVLRLARARTRAMIDRGSWLRTIFPAPTRVPPMISVIIPAHNEEAYLPRTLEALGRQKYPCFETIVVANGCTDQTPAVARDHCNTLVIVSTKGLGLARNLGAKLACGELLIFLDADTELSPGALRLIARHFQRNAAAGTVKGRPDIGQLSYRLIYFLKNFTHRWSLHNGSSGVLICWKNDFVRAGGFDEALDVRENSDLIRRLRRWGKYRYIPQAVATTSMRRYEKKGTGRAVFFWLKLWLESFFSDLRHRSYETVR